MMRQNPPVDLTPDLWMVKLLMGAIDPSYDSQDEVRSYRPGNGVAPQQQYGAPSGPPPTQYGASQQYGAPQGQQYAPPPGPPSQYGGPQGNYGQGPPQQQGYNRPPPQAPYPGSQPGGCK